MRLLMATGTMDVAETGPETSPFEGIVGNEGARRTLSRALESGPSHAYLFHGPPGVGKRTVARRFGAALVSGGDVAAERRARRGLHPDLSEIQPDGSFTTIGQVREVVRLASSRPFEGAGRVILLEADTLNAQAANALLKTLEEPEEGTTFILLAASRGGVLPTVSSRAQAVRFDPVPKDEVTAFLRERGGTEPDLAAALGRGSVGLSLRYAEDKDLGDLRGAVFGAGLSFAGDFEERHRAVGEISSRAEAVGGAREKEVLESFEDPDRRARDRAKRAGRGAREAAVREAVEMLAMLYRDAGVIEAGAEGLVANVDRVEEIRGAVRDHPGADWAGAALLLEEARGGLAYNVSPEATLEVTLSRIRQAVLGHSRGS